MGLFLYNLFLAFYHTGIRIAALWNKKAAQWVNGRRTQKISPLSSAQQTVWMHCASLGEFEQGRPVLEAVKQAYPNACIVLTFFSPSGYEIRKNYPGAHHVLYLPMDGPLAAPKFVEQINPTLVLWVKYEYWYYYLSALKKRNIPVLLVSGIFRKEQPFFKWYGGFWKTILQCFDHLFVQTEQSLSLLKHIIAPQQITVGGDTRFDRVASIAAGWKGDNAAMQKFCTGHKVIVAGSTWEEDEEILIHYARINPHIRFVFAPHEVGPERINDLKEEFPQALLYSQLIKMQADEAIDAHVLIIDNIGLLSSLYGYADIAYIGGGFNQSGIHNILEAAVYGKPIVFGPVYQKFAEAVQLVTQQGAFSIENALELEDVLNQLWSDERSLQKAGKANSNYVQLQCGATEKIMDYIQRKRLLTN